MRSRGDETHGRDHLAIYTTRTASMPSPLRSPDARMSSSESTPSSPPPSKANASVGVKDKQVQRERERRSRLNRRKKYEKLQMLAASLERTALVLPMVDDADPIWNELLDDDAKRTRAHLQRSITVWNEVKRLTGEKALLQRLLTEHELARRAVAVLMKGRVATDKWRTNCEKWKALTRIHFEPLTITECIKLVNDSIGEMVEYLRREGKLTSGVSFMGWQESRRHGKTALEFTLFKTYRGYDLNHHIDMTWRVYSEAALYSRVILGGRGRLSMDTVQKISPTAWVIRTAMTLDETDVTVHDIFLLFQVKTEDGAFLCARALTASALQRAIETPSDPWMHNITWIRWAVLDPLKDWSSTDYRMCVGGANHPANRSFLELVAIAVRSDNIITGRPMLAFSW